VNASYALGMHIESTSYIHNFSTTFWTNEADNSNQASTVLRDTS